MIIAENKLCYDTVNLLRKKGWVARLPGTSRQEYLGDDYWVLHSAVANLILGAVADECSSPTMPPVTDDPGSFTANCNLLLTELGAQHGITFKESRTSKSETKEGDSAFSLLRVPRLSLKEGFQGEALRRV